MYVLFTIAFVGVNKFLLIIIIYIENYVQKFALP